MATRASRVGLSKLKAFAVRIVLAVNRNQCWDTKAAEIFLTHFGTWALRRNHDDRDVFTNLHALFNDVEAV